MILRLIITLNNKIILNINIQSGFTIKKHNYFSKSLG
jgi:hypothetical protein